jgi:hypothetical protein
VKSDGAAALVNEHKKLSTCFGSRIDAYCQSNTNRVCDITNSMLRRLSRIQLVSMVTVIVCDVVNSLTRFQS